MNCSPSNDIPKMECKNLDSILFTYSEPESYLSRTLKFGMKILGMKTGLESAMTKGTGKTLPEVPSNSLQKDFLFITKNFKNRNLWIISPKEKKSDTIIFYLHGGAYINNIIKFQWNMIEEILRKTNTQIVVPDYPLAPDSQYDEVYSFIEEVYLDLLKESKSESIVFLGDSAGGGLSLGLAQKLQKENKPGPSQILLVSPWLDVSLNDPEIKNIDPLDHLLHVEGLQWAGKIYAGKESLDNPLISPIYGDVNGLGKISIFIGTHDILYPDSLQLKKKLEENQIPFRYFEYPNMFHVWPVINGMKEANYAIEQIANLILCGK